MRTVRSVDADPSADAPALAEAIGQIGHLVDGLRDRIRLLEAVFSNFPGGIALFDADLKMVLCNGELRRLLDYPDVLFSTGNPNMAQLFRFNAERGEYGPGSAEEHVARRMALVHQKVAHVYERTRPNGTILEIRGVPIEGGGFLTTYVDVTDQRRNQALIAHMAHHDALTDLPNRLLFNDRMQTAVALAKRGGLVAVHYLDVDGFKPVNDVFGHQAGDELLVGIAGRLSRSVRENDTVARLGGDEFAVIQTGILTREDASVLARRLVRAFEHPFEACGNAVSVGVSIGIALGPDDGATSDALLSRADAALYRSKSTGRGRFTFHADIAA